jgi:hypothetical protein
MDKFNFEFDQVKNSINEKKHSINFTEAQELWKDVFRVIIPAKTRDEERHIIIAEFKQKIWTAIFTIRQNNIRIISVRSARKNEKEIYRSK